MPTLRHNIANLISVPITLVRLTVMKAMYTKRIRFSLIERFSLNVVVDMDRKSKMSFGNRVSLRSGCRFSANSGGELTVGKHCSFNVGCIVVCRKKISIGDNVSVGPNVMIYDHDHIMGVADGVKTTPFKLGEVVIGDGTWIGAGTILLSGTNVGKNCIIAAGSIVKGNVPDNTVFIQKRVSTLKENEEIYEQSESLDNNTCV